MSEIFLSFKQVPLAAQAANRTFGRKIFSFLAKCDEVSQRLKKILTIYNWEVHNAAIRYTHSRF